MANSVNLSTFIRPEKITRKLYLLMTSFHTEGQALPIAQVAQQAFEQHAAYKEPSLRHRRFKHHDIVPLLEQLRHHPLFEVQVVGKSVEKRDIYLVKAGTGKTKVMLWSQMHGDEATATMALFDLLHFLQQADQMDPVRQQILRDTTLYFIPMLNPDGAERFTRRNALEIDLNRDAQRLQSPEAELLKNLRTQLNPAIGFNLHDQSIYYTAGGTSKPATVSFLAPAFDHAQTVDAVRGRAMRTIVGMNEALQQLIPGQVAKFSDEHEPRAFGDNIQKWGTSVILVESGGYHNDPEKQYIRRLNFAALVSGLHLIAGQGYDAYELEDYYSIPENQRNLYDLVIRNVRYQTSGREVLLDAGILREEVETPAAQGFYYRSIVEELGDMSTFYGYEELDGDGLQLVPGKVYEEPFDNIAALPAERARELLASGYTTVRLADLPDPQHPFALPLNALSLTGEADHGLGMGRGADFTLQDARGTVRYAVVNGFVHDLAAEKPSPFYGLVL
ncbi:M14 family zinc carboxypeptidase [Pontibacter actiniarum]|nr:M14 family zinc carboxypeptidase [Pontibacter actiniarum]